MLFAPIPRMLVGMGGGSCHYQGVEERHARVRRVGEHRSGVLGGGLVGLAILSLMVTIAACRRGETPARRPEAVTLYASVDEPFARMVVDRFQRESGIRVALITDSEAGKTTGLVQRIVTEAQTERVRADVFWSGELAQTIWLARGGLLEPYDPPKARDIPERFRDSGRRWTALAVRARVLAYDPRRVRREDVPQRWEDLGRREVARYLALANPLFGTTRTHLGAMNTQWGSERIRAFLNGLRDGGAQVVDGNSTAVRTVLSGAALFAATDSDDVYVARKSGANLEMIHPDMGDGGTLLIPCTVALLAGAPNAEGGRMLVDYLVSAEVEEMLARSASGNVPVRFELRERLGMAWPHESRVDYHAIVDGLDDAVGMARELLLR